MHLQRRPRRPWSSSPTPTFGSPTTIRRSFAGGSISIDDNNGTAADFCSDATGLIDTTTRPRSSTLDKILVNGTPNFEHLVELNETQGTFAPGARLYEPDRQAPHSRSRLLTGTGGDVVDVDGTGFDDAYLRLTARRSADGSTSTTTATRRLASPPVAHHACTAASATTACRRMNVFGQIPQPAAHPRRRMATTR